MEANLKDLPDSGRVLVSVSKPHTAQLCKINDTSFTGYADRDITSCPNSVKLHSTQKVVSDSDCCKATEPTLESDLIVEIEAVAQRGDDALVRVVSMVVGVVTL